MGDESIVLGGNEIDAEYRPNVNYVPPQPEVTSESEMSDEARLRTTEGEAETILFKEEVTGEEKKETAPPAKETSPEKKVEKQGEEDLEEKPAEEKKTAEEKKQDDYSKKVQKRMNKMTFKTHEEARRADRAEAKLKERDDEIRKLTTEKAKAEISSKKPQEDTFESEAEYYEALGRWATRSEMIEIESEKKAETTTDTSPAPTEDLPPEVQAMLKLGAEAHDDFDDAVASSQTLPQNLVEEAMETKEIAHDIIYYLAKNQDEAVRIAALTPKAITREIGKIEAGLSAPSPSKNTEDETHEDTSEESNSSTDEPPNPKPKKTTNAPPPISPIKPGATTTTPDQNNMTNKEYRASRGFTSGAIKKRE